MAKDSRAAHEEYGQRALQEKAKKAHRKVDAYWRLPISSSYEERAPNAG